MKNAYYESPIGLMQISGSDELINSLIFVEKLNLPAGDSNSYLDYCITQLSEYFDGTRKEFHLNLKPEGSLFQLKVWDSLLKIPFGTTKTYLWQSKELGNELAIRAVANANRRNRISVIVPCHRVIGSDGTLTGYAGGLWRKKWLLEHEANYSKREHQLNLNF